MCMVIFFFFSLDTTTSDLINYDSMPVAPGVCIYSVFNHTTIDYILHSDLQDRLEIKFLDLLLKWLCSQ